MAKFSEVLTIINGKNQKKVENPNGQYPIYGSGGIMGYADDFLCDANTVVIGRKGSINKPIFVDVPFWNVDTAFGLSAKEDVLLPKYLYYFCENFDFERLNTTVTIPSLTKANLLEVEINIPEIQTQYQVVNVLNEVCDMIAIRKQQLDKLDELVKAWFVELFGDPETNTKGWPISNMCNLCSVGSSKRIYQSEQSSAGIPFWRVADLTNLINTGVATENLYIPEKRYAELQAQGQVPVEGDILVTSRGTLGQCYIVKATDKFYFQDGMISWLSEYADGITPLYIAHLFSMPGFRKQIDSMQAGSTVAYLSIAMIKKLMVMIPNIETQQQFAAFAEQTDQCRLTIQRGLDKLEMMKKALMQQYFG